MGRSLLRACLSSVVVGVLAVTPLAAAARSVAPPQVPAPYALYVRGDCELKSVYAASTKSTVVQLSLTPPGPGGTPSGVSLVLRAEYPGAGPAVAPNDIDVLVLPAVNSNPTVVRGLQLELVMERDGAAPVTLSYFGRSWGDYGFVPAGAEITRVAFTVHAAELKALLVADRVTGRVMNASFVLTGAEMAALREFASAIGMADAKVTPATHHAAA